MKWTCPICGESTPNPTVVDGKQTHPRIEHLTTHNPSPAQWTNAYNMIQAGKERAAKAAKANPSA